MVGDVQTTRKNIQSGDLNLWDVPPVVEATMVGLGIGKDSPQRARVKAKESAQHTKETVLNIALAVFNIGFGLAGALLTGPVGLAFTAGALGLSSYDAFKTTEDHFVKNAVANTSIDPDGGLLPAGAKQSWGWLVVAWGGVALSFADVLKAEKVAEEVGKVAKGGKTVAEAAEALAKGDKKLLEQLRRAAGDAKVTETITEALRPGLGRRIGAEITEVHRDFLVQNSVSSWIEELLVQSLWRRGKARDFLAGFVGASFERPSSTSGIDEGFDGAQMLCWPDRGPDRAPQ